LRSIGMNFFRSNDDTEEINQREWDNKMKKVEMNAHRVPSSLKDSLQGNWIIPQSDIGIFFSQVFPYFSRIY
jgi:hypothetical protein